eukprot:357374-Chlamydomonas_euryale.AAC.2
MPKLAQPGCLPDARSGRWVDRSQIALSRVEIIGRCVQRHGMQTLKTCYSLLQPVYSGQSCDRTVAMGLLPKSRAPARLLCWRLPDCCEAARA